MEEVCRKCGGEMKPSQALDNIMSGHSDFIGGEVCTVSPSGRAKLIDCLKCQKCGWSVTVEAKEEVKHEH